MSEKVILLTEDIGNLKVGDNLFCSAGAPGIGYTIERITRIDEKFVYGYLIKDTTRILDPSEYDLQDASFSDRALDELQEDVDLDELEEDNSTDIKQAWRSKFS